MERRGERRGEGEKAVELHRLRNGDASPADTCGAICSTLLWALIVQSESLKSLDYKAHLARSFVSMMYSQGYSIGGGVYFEHNKYCCVFMEGWI